MPHDLYKVSGGDKARFVPHLSASVPSGNVKKLLSLSPFRPGFDIVLSITSAQLRGARGLLGWSKLDLAKASCLSISVVLNAEGRDPALASPEAMAAMRKALEAAGVEFMPDNNGLRMCFEADRSSVFSRFM